MDGMHWANGWIWKDLRFWKFHLCDFVMDWVYESSVCAGTFAKLTLRNAFDQYTLLWSHSGIDLDGIWKCISCALTIRVKYLLLLHLQIQWFDMLVSQGTRDKFLNYWRFTTEFWVLATVHAGFLNDEALRTGRSGGIWSWSLLTLKKALQKWCPRPFVSRIIN